MKIPVGLLILFVAIKCIAADWVRAGLSSDTPVWGFRGGLQFAIYPAGFRGDKGGPRGLIRLGYPVLENEKYDLVNYIAVEPVVDGLKGYSELESSHLDNAQGKRFWTGDSTGQTNGTPSLHPGKLWKPEPGVERLDVTLRLEKFDNGAHLYLVVSQRSDRPDEIQLAVFPEKNSAAVDYCILTATMGNYARARQLWLKDQVISSLKLYQDYTGTDFADHTLYSLNQLHLTPQGEVLAALTTDEDNPADVRPFPGSGRWYYRGQKVTQYWKKGAGAFRDDLHVAVNARYAYWKSKQPIPGGISFENFEMRERFYPGQSFIFGITRRTAKELGFDAAPDSTH